MSKTHCVIARARRVRSARGLAAATALLLPCFLPGLSGTPAAAHAVADKPREPSPPARMSAVGGERLGLPGVQIEPRAGAGTPELPDSITSRAWIVADAETGDVLAAKNAHWPLAPASTIKMLFADTLLPKFDKDRVHRVSREELLRVGPGSSMVGLKEGLTYTVDDLWKGVFLRSGNDAVHALAELNGGVDKTVREMNEHARRLGATDTHVVSPDGYDAEGHVSSAYDLTLFARSGMQKPDFRAYAATVRAQFPGDVEKGKDGKKKRGTFEIQNTNRLLTGAPGLEPYEGIAGVKNGYTTNAGSTFTGVAQRGDRVLLVTAMHPEGGGLSVYEETADLLDWGFEAAGKTEPVGELVPPEGAAYGSGKNADDRPGSQAGGADAQPAGPTTPNAARTHGPSDGAGTALMIVVAVLVALGAGAYGVRRRWPLPGVAGLPHPGRGPQGPAVLGGPGNPGALERIVTRPAAPGRPQSAASAPGSGGSAGRTEGAGGAGARAPRNPGTPGAPEDAGNPEDSGEGPATGPVGTEPPAPPAEGAGTP
ncbi:D-alanyl-D-alanine carboxypeptidase [Streptomyces radiopugnans]|uniref:D-alanyl-D-alanine carboxypeptidase (Penicillin-binding protein 5/6) n=1 Tax=Streptomyces radiopugnans TaxID=403935 RepID=A0A1H9HWH8_9ACTN|nr:D-alanyl-D-alanine carboxypeptidase (penicillin-binding protein 5/6) [Streptomyces radiopugnans]